MRSRENVRALVPRHMPGREQPVDIGGLGRAGRHFHEEKVIFPAFQLLQFVYQQLVMRSGSKPCERANSVRLLRASLRHRSSRAANACNSGEFFVSGVVEVDCA